MAEILSSDVVTLKRGMIEPKFALRYILAGNSILTFVNKERGTHVTFKIKKCNRKGEEHKFFVSALTGPDNTSHYQFFGTIYSYENGKPTFYYSEGKAKLSQDSKMVKSFLHIFSHLVAGHVFTTLEIWHSSQCCRCGRLLTVESSIAAGMGPHCATFFPDIKPETKIPEVILNNYLKSI